MKNFACLVGGAALLAVVTLTLSPTSAIAQKDPSVKEIMTRAHKGGDSILTRLGRQLKSDSPDWAQVQEETKELVKLGTSLGKNEPPKGDKASWDRLTKEYVTNAEALDTAAQKKDRPTAAASQRKLAGSCQACHKAHRPPS